MRVENDTLLWLSVPEVAEALNLRGRDVRSMLQDKGLLAIRRGEHNALAIPDVFLVKLNGSCEVVRGLTGTITLLADNGLSDDEAMDWLLSYEASLGQSPIDALRAGNIHLVRRAAALA